MIDKKDWREPVPPTKHKPDFHTYLSTPVGTLFISWDSWRDNPTYEITIGSNHFATADSLEEAKELAIKHIKQKSEELIKFLT
jgi:hypothetical protein